MHWIDKCYSWLNKYLKWFLLVYYIISYPINWALIKYVNLPNDKESFPSLYKSIDDYPFIKSKWAIDILMSPISLIMKGFVWMWLTIFESVAWLADYLFF